MTPRKGKARLMNFRKKGCNLFTHLLETLTKISTIYGVIRRTVDKKPQRNKDEILEDHGCIILNLRWPMYNDSTLMYGSEWNTSHGLGLNSRIQAAEMRFLRTAKGYSEYCRIGNDAIKQESGIFSTNSIEPTNQTRCKGCWHEAVRNIPKREFIWCAEKGKKVI